MISERPAPPSVHPEVAADAGEDELLELTDEEIEHELGGSVDPTSDEEAALLEAERRSLEESGAWEPIPSIRPPPNGPPSAAVDLNAGATKAKNAGG
jgi:hypothetical protein